MSKAANLNSSISSAQDIPASHSVKPESAEEHQTPGIFGPKPIASCAYLDPDMCCWKTSQDTFLSDLETYSGIWPDAGMMRNGVVYEQAILEPPICESGSSLLDTWRTPDSPGTGGPRNRQHSIGEGHQVTIAEQAEHWKTPHGMSNLDFKGKVGGCGGGEFGKQANQWQTPATDSFRSRGGDRKDEPGLDQHARMFPTPNAKEKQITLCEQIAAFPASLPAPPIPDGPPFSESAPTSRPRWPTPTDSMATMQDMQQARTAGNSPSRPQYASLEKRRLNPRFVEWLQGFPLRWTEL